MKRSKKEAMKRRRVRASQAQSFYMRADTLHVTTTVHPDGKTVRMFAELFPCTDHPNVIGVWTCDLLSKEMSKVTGLLEYMAAECGLTLTAEVAS